MKVFLFSDCKDIARIEIELSIIKHSKGKINKSDITFIPIDNFSVLHCSFSMRLLADLVPDNSIFYSVVNPCDKEYERISGKTKVNNIYFIGRNTGAFGWLCDDFGIDEIYSYENIPFVPFGGREIYPKIISNIIDSELKPEYEKSIYNNEVRGVELKNGTVVHIDNFGLIKVYTDLKNTLEKGSKYNVFNIRTGESFKAVCNPRIMSGTDYEYSIYSGSSLNGMVEIGSVRSDIRSNYDIKIEDVLEITNEVF